MVQLPTGQSLLALPGDRGVAYSVLAVLLMVVTVWWLRRRAVLGLPWTIRATPALPSTRKAETQPPDEIEVLDAGPRPGRRAR